MTDHERVIRELRDARIESGMTQTELGTEVGMRQSVISRIEADMVSPQLNTLLKLLSPLGKTLAVVDKEDAC